MNRAKPLPSQEELLRMFHYDSETGRLYWRISPATRINAGDLAGRIDTYGRRTVTLNGQAYKAYRVAWKMMTGKDPVTIDHVNRNQSDDRFCNLRDASVVEQNNNRFIPRIARLDLEARVVRLSAQHAPKTRDARAKPLPSQDRLKDLFDYDPITGVLLNKIGSLNGKRVVGAPAKSLSRGYYKTRVDGREAYVHRIVWKIMTGEEPDIVDHIDGNPINNAWSNLRSVRHAQNLGNTPPPRHNKSGVKGVYWAKDKNRWTAQIGVGGKAVYLGRYKTIEEAKSAYEAAAFLHFGFLPSKTKERISA